MTTITFDTLADEVLRLADEHPEAVYRPSVYDGCLYLGGEGAGLCGCLFGQALLNLGASREVLAKADWHSDPIGMLLPNLDVGTTAGQLEALSVAQRVQDEGGEWFEAVQPLRQYREREATR